MEKIYKFILYNYRFSVFIIICLSTYRCDFEPPQAFEAPSWELPITIPLIETEYSLLDMLGDNNSLELNEDTTSFVIEIEQEVIPEDGEGEAGDPRHVCLWTASDIWLAIVLFHMRS